MKKAEFRESDHSYWIGKKKLISVTQLMQKHGLSTDYSAVDSETLSKKGERGTFIHSEIENYIKSGEIGFTPELEFFINTANEYGFTDMVAEEIVNNAEVAGTIDLQAMIGKSSVIADYKTCATLNKEAVRWQLSLYERLSGKHFDKLLVFHLVEKPKVIELERIPTEEIDKLLTAELNGEIYQKRELAVSQMLLARLEDTETIIKEIESHQKEVEAIANEIKAQLIEVMAEQGIKSYETPNKSMLITYVEPTTRESVDTSKLKKELPDIAKQYLKISNVKASVRITLRG
ncbi:MAG: hypothetical protein RR458_03015 [Clostridia bacterium]